MDLKPKFGDVYRVEWLDNRPDDRRWMFITDKRMVAGSPITMMVLEGTFAGIFTHWDNLNGFVRVEE